MIKVLVDSASDYTMSEINEKGLLFVPLQIEMNGKTYLDEVEIDKQHFYELMIDSKEFYKTSQPSPQRYVTLFEEIKENKDSLICLCLSSQLSGTYQSAILAKSMVEYDSIYVIDTLSATCGIRLLTEMILKWIDDDVNIDTIVSRIENMKSRVRIVAGIDTLEYLARGGRISKSAALLGGFANIKPIIAIENGKVEMIGKARGINKATHFIQDWMERYEMDLQYPVYSIYSYGVENVERLEERLNLTCQRIQLGSTIGVHIGPGAFGLCFIGKDCV